MSASELRLIHIGGANEIFIAQQKKGSENEKKGGEDVEILQEHSLGKRDGRRASCALVSGDGGPALARRRSCEAAPEMRTTPPHVCGAQRCLTTRQKAEDASRGGGWIPFFFFKESFGGELLQKMVKLYEANQRKGSGGGGRWGGQKNGWK